MKHVSIGTNSVVDGDATLGYDGDEQSAPTAIGERARIRSGTVIYANVEIGDGLITGHDALVRSGTTIGDDTLVGTGVVIDGECTVGSHVSLQTRCYLPTGTHVEDHVFIGPHAVLTNDKHPVRRDSELHGPVLQTGVSIGANATVLPDVTVGRDSFVAAGAIVTTDVPPHTLAVGAPARHRELPPELAGGNQLA